MCHGYDCLCENYLKKLASKGDKKAFFELKKRKNCASESPKRNKKGK